MLTNKELVIYKLILSGYNAENISKILHITKAKTKKYLNLIYAELGVKNRVQLLVKYLCITE